MPLAAYYVQNAIIFQGHRTYISEFTLASMTKLLTIWQAHKWVTLFAFAYIRGRWPKFPQVG